MCEKRNVLKVTCERRVGSGRVKNKERSSFSIIKRYKTYNETLKSSEMRGGRKLLLSDNETQGKGQIGNLRGFVNFSFSKRFEFTN